MLRGLLLLLSALALMAPAAVAQDDEIFVDPGSPSGKEYALPVESARKQAAKDAQGSSSSAQPAPLFGEGVDDRSTADAGGAGSGSGSGSGSGAAKGSRGGTDDADGGTPATSAATLKAQAAAPDGGIGLAAVIGVGAGVLLLGGAIGVLLRRRSTRS